MEKKKSNINGHGEIYDEFLIIYYILHSQPSVFQVGNFNSWRDLERLQT